MAIRQCANRLTPRERTTILYYSGLLLALLNSYKERLHEPELSDTHTRGDSPIKMTGVLVGNFEKTPKRYQNLD